MDYSQSNDNTGQRMTLCPVCLEEVSVRQLVKHLHKSHAQLSSLKCISCSKTLNKHAYFGHILRRHSKDLWVGSGAKQTQLKMVIQRWYILKPGYNTTYICSACKKEVQKSDLFIHQKRAHRIDYLDPKVIAAMQPDKFTAGYVEPESDKRHEDTPEDRLRVNGVVPLRVCQNLIINSAYWYTHTSGRPARAPKHHERITYSKYIGGKISFGANTFLIQKAAEQLIQLLENKTDLNGKLLIDPEVFKKKATDIVSSSVKGMRGRYSKYPIKEDGHMIFGAQSIHVPSFINTIREEFVKTNRTAN